MPRAEVDRARVPGLPDQRIVGAPRAAGTPQRQRHDVALIVELAHELVQRERPRAGRRRVQEGRVRHLVQTIEQGAQAIVEVARGRGQPLLEGVKPGERLDVTLGSDRQADVGACGRRACRGRRRRPACVRAPGRRRRESRRGCVVSGSARQTTTTCARSRISPSVAVELPRRASAPPARPAPVSTAAPSRSASAIATRAASTVAPSKPQISGRRASRSSSAARRTATSRSTGSPRTRAPASSSGTRAANQVSATGHRGSTRTGSAVRSTTTSSQTVPQPAQMTSAMHLDRLG